MSLTRNFARPVWYVGAGLLFCGSLAATALYARADEWHPLSLVLLLGALALFGQHLVVMIRAQAVSAVNLALVLAMCLLGPAPAVAFGVATMVYRSTTGRRDFSDWMVNLSTFAAFPLVGGVITAALIGNVHDPQNHATRGFTFALVVFGVFLATGVLNFILIALHGRVFWGRSLRDQVLQLFVPLLPAELAAGLLTVIAALAYTNLGIGWSLGGVFALLTFQVLIVRLIRAENVLEQLRTSVHALVSSQVGTIRAAVKFLDARDPGSERHAAAVAIYARELAAEVGCTKEEQHFVHAAGLAHDIGRLAFHDHVLNATEIIDEEDWQEIRRHPVQGSYWVGHIHGYGPVADVILSHHERWDGSGYPDEFIGPEIPRLSRILAICEAFDAMTAPHTYRSRMTAQDAFEQLRASAGSQFDPELVEAFIAMRRRHGAKDLTVEDADFDAELDFERRVRMLADPDDERTSPLARKLLSRVGGFLSP
jgi:HD-GYP domain-containing protein (c-di-GMP phosphodiesterase class II)